MDEARGTAAERTTHAADVIERESDGKWTTLCEGDLVLLRRFDVGKRHGQKLETQWEGPYRLVDMAYHGRLARLQDIHTGDIVRVKKGGLRKQVHLNELKLFFPCQVDGFGKSMVVEENLVELGEWNAG